MSQFLIATSVLEAIVRGSLEGQQGLRVHSPLPLVRTKPVDVIIDGEDCQVSVHLDARLGEFLPALATRARECVADALQRMTGLAVTRVDIVFSAVFPFDS